MRILDMFSESDYSGKSTKTKNSYQDDTFDNQKYLGENMDHSKDGQAVEELKAALLARKDSLQDKDSDTVYRIIDKLMTRIAKAHGLTGQEIHDMWVKKYTEIPDTWIMSESRLDEAASPALFHYTPVGAALEILKNNAFKLSISTGNVEAQYAPKGYNYFLSTSRSKVGGYHAVVGSSAVMFNLDGNWFNQRYPTKAIDYWAGLGRGDRHSETEDRIFSREPAIPADAITAIHILLQEGSDFNSPVTRQVLILAKKRGLPTYLYRDKDAWRLQNTKKAVSVTSSHDILRGQKKAGYVSNYPAGKYLEPWLELIFKKKRSELSKAANEIRRGLTYWSGGQFADDLGLRNEISNARKPGNEGYATAAKIIAAMRKIGVSDVKDLLLFLHKKWDAEALQKESFEQIEEALLRTDKYGGWIEHDGHVGYVDFGTGQSQWDGHAGYLLNMDYSQDKDPEEVMEEGWVRFITSNWSTHIDISLNGTLAGLRKHYRVYAQTVMSLPVGSRVFVEVLRGPNYTFMIPEQKRDFMKLLGPQAQAVAQPERELQTASRFNVSERTEGQFISPPGNTVGLNVFELSPEERQRLNGAVVYHQTKKLDKILQSGGLRPRADASGENSFALNDMRAGRDWRTPKGIFVSQTKSDWFGDEIAFKIEPNDRIYRAYNPEMGHLLIANAIPSERFISVNDKPLTEGPIWNKIKGAATAGAVAGTIGYSALSGQAAKSPEMELPKATIQQVQPTKAAPITPAAPKAQVTPTLTIPQLEKSTSMDVDTDRQKILWKIASSSGLKGTEAAQFLAQAAHETLGFNTLVELGSKEYFKQYDIRFNPEKARLLGNVKPGDGVRYKGRGFIQITGRDNYRKAGEALGIPLEKKPELASKPEIAAKIAVWFWKTRVRPNVSDWTDTRSVTRKINPAMQGLEDRHTNFYDYMKKLKVAAN